MISLDPQNSSLQFRCVQCLAQGPTVMKGQKPHVDPSGPAPEPTVRKEMAVSHRREHRTGAASSDTR